MVGLDLLTAAQFCWQCYVLNLPSLCHHVAAWVCSFGRMRWPQSEECLRVSGFGFLKLGWQGEQTRDVASTLRWNQFLKNMVRVLWIVGHKLRLKCNSATFSLGAGFSLYVDVLFSNLGFQPQPYIEVVIVDLLLLNMVLAILMDAYQVAWLNIPKGLATLTSVVLVAPGIQGSEEQGQRDDHGATSDFWNPTTPSPGTREEVRRGLRDCNLRNMSIFRKAL